MTAVSSLIRSINLAIFNDAPKGHSAVSLGRNGIFEGNDGSP
jgi:hypothetical protein